MSAREMSEGDVETGLRLRAIADSEAAAGTPLGERRLLPAAAGGVLGVQGVGRAVELTRSHRPIVCMGGDGSSESWL
jgi:hypothetical protein